MASVSSVRHSSTVVEGGRDGLQTPETGWNVCMLCCAWQESGPASGCGAATKKSDGGWRSNAIRCVVSALSTSHTEKERSAIYETITICDKKQFVDFIEPSTGHTGGHYAAHTGSYLAFAALSPLSHHGILP